MSRFLFQRNWLIEKVYLASTCVTLFVLMSLPANGGSILADYAFTGGSAVSSDTDADSQAVDFAAITVIGESGSLSDGGLSSGGNAYLRTSATGTDQAAALADDDYFTFSVNAASGMVLNLETLEFDSGVSINLASGTLDPAFTNTFYVQSSVDGFGASGSVVAQGNGTRSTSTGGNMVVLNDVSVDLTAEPFQGLSSITFRFSFSDSHDEVAVAINRLDNVVLTGTVVPASVPEPSGLILLLSMAGLFIARRSRR